MPAPHIFIGSYHKSGTVWMLTTFIRMAKANGYCFVHLNEGESGWNLRSDKDAYFETKRAHVEHESEAPSVFYNYHCDIPDLTRTKQERGVRGLQIVRDPRDMLVSAARFHLISNEAWLHEPNPSFGGLTYQQKLATYTKLEDRIRFEIDHHMGDTIRRMSQFDSQGVFRRVHYEDLIVDVDMTLFHELMVYLGMGGRALINALDAFWISSIFGDRPDNDFVTTRNHIFNSRPKQWANELEPSVLKLIEDVFEREVLALGYELSDERSICDTKCL